MIFVTRLNKAVKSLFQKKGKLFSIASWFIDGFTDMFKIVIDVFLNILGGALKGMFGDLITFKPSARSALSATKFDLKAQKEGAARAQKQLSFGADPGKIDSKDIGSLTHVLETKIGTIKDSDTRDTLLKALDKQRDMFKTSDNTEADKVKLALFSKNMIDRIEGGEYTGSQIEKSIGSKGKEELKYISHEDYAKRAQKNIQKFQDLFSKAIDPTMYKGTGVGYAKRKTFPAELLQNTSVVRFISEIDNFIDVEGFFNYFNTLDKEKIRDKLGYTTGLESTRTKNKKFFEKHLFNHLTKYNDKKSGKSYNDILRTLVFSLFKLKSDDHLFGNSTADKLKDKRLNLAAGRNIQDLTENMFKGQSVKTPQASEQALKEKTDAISPQKASEPSTAVPTAPTVEATPSAPISKDSTIEPGSKSKKATKKAVEQEKEKLNNLKQKVSQEGPITVTPQKAQIDCEELGVQLCKAGLADKIADPKNASSTGTYFSKDGQKNRSINKATDGDINPVKISENTEVISSDVREDD